MIEFYKPICSKSPFRLLERKNHPEQPCRCVAESFIKGAGGCVSLLCRGFHIDPLSTCFANEAFHLKEEDFPKSLALEKLSKRSWPKRTDETLFLVKTSHKSEL